MEKKILNYESEEITVSYDVNRCIHAANCVNGLPDVFDPDRKPWIAPGNAAGEKVADVIETCPSGALKYELKRSEREEKPSSRNRISLQKDGPIYMFGDIQVRDHNNNVVLEDTRLAFCRCGSSGNKPSCDNSHQKIDFEAGTDADPSKLPETVNDTHSKLIVKMMKNGPAILEGVYSVESDTMEALTSEKGVALCRCGASGTKPFCDGSHKAAGFEG